MPRNNYLKHRGAAMSNSNYGIWTKKECIENYDEVMLRIAMSSYAEIHGEEMIRENNALKQAQSYPHPPDIGKMIRKRLNKKRTKTAAHAIANQSYKALSKVAVVFLVLSIVFAFSLQVGAVRSAIYKLIFTYEKEYTLVQLDKATSLEFVSSDVYTWEHAFAPTMLPAGYEINDVNILPSQNIVIYNNQKNGFIEFWQSNASSDGQWYADTEDADSVQQIYINDSEAILITKQGTNSLLWRAGNIILQVISNEDADTVISIAKNIKLLK